MQEQFYWLPFNVFSGIGPMKFRALLKIFGSAKNVWQAQGRDLEAGISGKLLEKFLSFRQTFSLEKYLEKMAKAKVRFVTLQDSEYPKLLKEISDAPPVLYIKDPLSAEVGQGNFFRPQIVRQQVSRSASPQKFCGLTAESALAVVGTRKMTPYGQQVTEMLVRDLVDYGFTIVSGLALGVDGVAHKAALEAKGKTIAVLGCGVDIIYPPSHRYLYQEIIEKGGAIVSEVPLGTYVTRGIFPARNRLISGMSLGVLVTEGTQDSGTLITARYAAEQGREVFAVPGPITSKTSAAPSILLKQGAKLVSSVDDILEELGLEKKVKAEKKIKGIADLSKEEGQIWKILTKENLHIDEIVRRLDLPTERTGSILSMMEVKGLIERLSDGKYTIKT